MRRKPWGGEEPQEITYTRRDLTSEVLIPLLQSLAVGVAIAVVIIVLTGFFRGGGLLLRVEAASAIGLVVACVLIAWRFTKDVRAPYIQALEERVGVDIDRDGVVGVPQRPAIDPMRIDSLARLFIRNVYNGLPTSRRWWVDEQRLMSQTEWEIVVRRLRARGILERVEGQADSLLAASEAEAWERYISAPQAGHWVVSEDEDLVALE